MYFEIYHKVGGMPGHGPSGRGDWRWRLKAANHEIIASGEGYASRDACVHAIALVQLTTADTPVRMTLNG